MFRSRQVPAHLRHPQAEAHKGEMHPLRERRRPLLPPQALPRAVLDQKLRIELRATSQLQVSFLFRHVLLSRHHVRSGND